MNDLNQMKILIVDDSQDSSDLIERLLSDSGYENIQVVCSAIEALESVNHFPPDLILLDIVMPDMTGFEFCKTVKSDPVTMNIPVIMVSGSFKDSDEALQKAFNVGAVDFIPKPVRRPEVLARWGKLLAEIRRPMSKRRFELVTFAAALELRNTACSLAHGKALLEFFSADEVLKMKEEKFSESVTETERAVFRFSRKVARDAARVTSGDVDLLKKHGLNDDEIFDIAATAAGRAFFTKLLDALGVETDSIFVELESTFRRAMTVGRPIGYRPVERVPGSTGGR